MSLYIRNKTWWCRKQYRGRLIRISLETSDRDKAEERYQKILGEIESGYYFKKDSDHTVSELLERYNVSRLKRMSLNTLLRDTVLRKHVESFFGRYRLREITPEIIETYRLSRYDENKSIATVNRELAYFRNALNTAIRVYNWIDVNPFRNIKLDKETIRERYLSIEEEDRLLPQLPNVLKEIVVFTLNTGLRQSEVLNLTRENIDFSRKVITVRGKGSSYRTIPLNKTALQILEKKVKTRHINTNLVFFTQSGNKILRWNLGKTFRRALKRANIENFHFHDLRHSFASRLAQTGVDLYSISRLLGHKDISTSQRYAHLNVESLRNIVERLTSVS